MTLTVAQIREHVEATNLVDGAITRIINAEEARIDRWCGKATSLTEVQQAAGLTFIFTRRPISSITSIKERHHQASDQVTLSANDYRQISDRQLQRLAGGDNSEPWWGSQVEIIYTPGTASAARELALIELTRISVEQRAAKSVKDGDYAMTYEDPQTARESILAGLTDGLALA